MSKNKVKNPINLPEDQSAWVDFVGGIAPGKAKHNKHHALAALVAMQERIDTDKAAYAQYMAAIKAARTEGETRKKERPVGVVHLYGQHLKGSAKARAVEVLRIARDESIGAAAVLKYLNKHGEAAFRENNGAEPPLKAKQLSKKQVEKARDAWVKRKEWLGEVSLPKAPRKKAGPVLIFAHQDGEGQVRVLDVAKANDNLFFKLLRAHSKRLKAGEKAKPKVAAKPKPKSSTASKKDALHIPGLEHLQGVKPKG